jgi:endonuclease/exonuclease/phosphatase family metal-dependent hydrolase
VLVRSWNLFHGNTLPPGRRAFLREMVELVTADRPDVVCLQEVPAWALGRLGAWAGMTEVPALARRPLVGTAGLGRALTSPHHGLIRSAFSGQGNSVLLGEAVRLRASATLPLHERAAGAEPRVAQRVELELPDGRTAVVVNVHCSHAEAGEAELARALRFGEEATPEGGLLVLAGDLNTTPERSATLIAAGLDAAIPESIDQVLVRGGGATARKWADDERAYGGRLLSDHAPVEATIRADARRVRQAMI